MRIPFCDDCQLPAKLVDSAVIYNGQSFGMAYICANFPKCDSYVGCQDDNRPLGRLANAELRKAKIKAHTSFDALWKKKISKDACSRRRARTAGYHWLADQLGISPKDCHIGMFDVEMCYRIVELCRPFLRRKLS